MSASNGCMLKCEFTESRKSANRLRWCAIARRHAYSLCAAISVSVALSPLVLAFVKIRQVTDVRSFWATAHVTTRFLSDINRFSAALGLIAQIDFRFPPRAGRSCPPLAHRLRLGLLLISPRCLNRSGESTQTDDRLAATATA